MSVERRLTKVFQNSEEIVIDTNSKIVLISDCHRGDGNWGDNFFKNQNIYFAALNYYYSKNYVYIELGDGDELWENRSMENIKVTHSDAFWLMSKFYQEKRFFMLYGNHDDVKKKPSFAKKNLSSYYDERTKKNVPLFPDIKIYEGLVLKIQNTMHKIFLVHGHQADFLNYNLILLSRFLVRYLWRPAELIGIKDPTSASKNRIKKEKVEQRLTEWAAKNNQILIAGHTHRPAFPNTEKSLYFNDGSCVHPRCITAIEIENASITLVKWTIKTKQDRTLFVERVILEGPVPLVEFYN